MPRVVVDGLPRLLRPGRLREFTSRTIPMAVSSVAGLRIGPDWVRVYPRRDPLWWPSQGLLLNIDDYFVHGEYSYRTELLCQQMVESVGEAALRFARTNMPGCPAVEVYGKSKHPTDAYYGAGLTWTGRSLSHVEYWQ